MAAQEVRDRYRSEVVIQYAFPDCVYGLSQHSFQWANKIALENAGPKTTGVALQPVSPLPCTQLANVSRWSPPRSGPEPEGRLPSLSFRFPLLVAIWISCIFLLMNSSAPAKRGQVYHPHFMGRNRAQWADLSSWRRKGPRQFLNSGFVLTLPHKVAPVRPWSPSMSR